MGIKRSSYLGATISYGPSTADGNGVALATPPLTALAAQVVVNGTGVGSFTVQGSLDGATWSTIIAASTYTGNRLIRSSTVGAVTYVRAVLGSHGSTKDVTIWLSGR